MLYSMSLFLVTLGLQQSLLTFVTNPSVALLIKQVAAGAYIGAGAVLFDMFITLARSYEPEKAKEKISNKIEKLQNKIAKLRKFQWTSHEKRVLDACSFLPDFLHPFGDSGFTSSNRPPFRHLFVSFTVANHQHRGQKVA